MNVPQILTTSCLLLTPLLSLAAGWEKLPPLPAPNGGAVVGVDHGRLIVAGGTNWKDGTKRWLKQVWALDPQTLTWKALEDLEAPVAYAVSGTSSSAGLVFAGGVHADGVSSKVQNLVENRMVARPAQLPLHAVLAAGGVYGNTLVFAGGAPDSTSLAKAGRETWGLDLDTLKLTQLATHPGRPFVTAASTMDALGRLYVLGGGTWDDAAQTVANLDQAHVFDLRKKAWKALRPLPYPVRGLSAAALHRETVPRGSVLDVQVYLAGGYKNDAEGFTDEAFLYDPAKDTYRAATPLPYKAMVSLAVLGDHLYCLGGEDKKQSRTDACYRISLAELLK